MKHLEQTIADLTPHLYADRVDAMRLPYGTDMSHSNQCQYLTHDMMQALQHRGLPVQRELHEDEYGNWHYLLAHAGEGVVASDSDIVTDLNPWQWTTDRRHSGPIHTTRGELYEILRDAGAPESFIALRSLETIVTRHQQNC